MYTDENPPLPFHPQFFFRICELPAPASGCERAEKACCARYRAPLMLGMLRAVGVVLVLALEQQIVARTTHSAAHCAREDALSCCCALPHDLILDSMLKGIVKCAQSTALLSATIGHGARGVGGALRCFSRAARALLLFTLFTELRSDVVSHPTQYISRSRAFPHVSRSAEAAASVRAHACGHIL